MPKASNSAGWNDAVVCANGVRNGLPLKTIRAITTTTIARPSNGAVLASGGVDVTYDGDRVVGVRAFVKAIVNDTDVTLNLGVPAENLRPQCAGYPQVGASTAGPVYRFNWNDEVCDNTSCTSSHSSASGAGCVAVAPQADGELAATFVIGGCDLSAFAPVPRVATVAIKKGLLDGLLLRFRSRGGAYGTRNDCGQQLFLNGYSTWAEVLRPAHSVTVSTGSQLTIVPLILTAAGDAKNWGGAVNVALRSSSGTTDPAAVTLKLTDFNRPSAPAGWGCNAKTAHSAPLDAPLPLYVWGGKGGKTYVGRAWVRVLDKDGQTADSHTGGGWSALVAFGAKDFSTR